MASIATIPHGAASGRHDLTQRILFVAVLLSLGIQAVLVFVQPINWDEFRFLADVHELTRNELTASVQTFHAHLFSWLPKLPGNEVDQIIAGRLVMLALECGTAALIYRCARHFGDVVSSLFALLCYISFSFIVLHGASFRFDPPSTFLMMAALTLLLTARLRLSVTATVGALVAVATLITIKSVFYVPTFIAVAWWRVNGSTDRRAALLLLAAGGVIGAAVLSLLYIYHQSHVLTGSIDAAQNFLASSVNKTIGHLQILHHTEFLLRSLIQNPANWVIIVTGAVVAIRQFASSTKQGRSEALALASFAAPLATLLFYRNAYPYYYCFMLAPVCVVAVRAAPCIAKYVRLEVLGIALTGIAFVQLTAMPRNILAGQRGVIDAVHEIFPTTTAYIDRCSMIASSRKQGFFMSTWGTEAYRGAGRPIFRDILLEKRPAYLLLNSPILETAMTGRGVDKRMLRSDAAVLRSHFIPHWGPIWVAGKRVDLSQKRARFEVLIAGRYTVESSAPVMIDGIPRRPMDTIIVGAGPHSAEGDGGILTLRWGNHLPVPAAEPPAAPLFSDL